MISLVSLCVLCCLCVFYSTAVAWNPAHLSSKIVRRTTAGLVGVSLSAYLIWPSNELPHQNNFITRAAESSLVQSSSVFDGEYKDPFHPGCLRKVSSKGTDITIQGSDNPSGVPIWSLSAKEEKAGEILVDFSPKGGPKNLLGVYSNNGIKWPDGNMWSKI